VNGVWIKQ